MDIARGECRLGLHLWVFPGHVGNHTSLQAGHLGKDKERVSQCPLSPQSQGGQQGGGSSEAGLGCTCPRLSGELPPRGHHPRPADSEGSKADTHSWGALSSWVKPTRVKGHCDLLHKVWCPPIPHPDLAPRDMTRDLPPQARASETHSPTSTSELQELIRLLSLSPSFLFPTLKKVAPKGAHVC